MAELFASPASGGRVTLYLVDVSEQRALETKFAQSQKMQAVGQLAGGVAHDFNNLLTVIIGNSEFLLMRHQAGDPSFKEINEIHQNALRAATLVGQLLAFSRKQTMQPKVLAVRDVVSELAQLLRRLLRDGVDLRLEQPGDVWPVHADEAQISNAVINLVVNARDAMPNGGTVTITTANEAVATATALGTAIMPAGDYVRIDVADTGVGIAKEHIGKIFDPFFTTKPVGQGTGLGLATVYGIVKQTGGFITVDSEVGRGTTFRIYLPRYHADPNAVVAVEPERAARDVTGQDTILLVEDEEAVRSFAARALKLRGYQVLEASGGEEALEIVRTATSPIALVITDAEHGRPDACSRPEEGKTRTRRDLHVGLCRRSVPPQRRERRRHPLPAQAVWPQAAGREGEGRTVERSATCCLGNDRAVGPFLREGQEATMIRKLPSGGYRLYSRKKNPKTGKRRNLGTFKSRAAAEKHERAVQYYKHGG
jgi:two-component system cell cycle sensor histidine kinase/response regulator CckA